MEDDEGTARKRQRRRAVRPAGPVAGAAAAEPETEALSLEKTAPEEAPPEAVTPEAVISESVTLEDDAAEADPAPRRRGVLLTGAFVLVVLALVATGVYLFVENRSVDADNARAERYVQTARQTVLNLTTISVRTPRRRTSIGSLRARVVISRPSSRAARARSSRSCSRPGWTPSGRSSRPGSRAVGTITVMSWLPLGPWCRTPMRPSPSRGTFGCGCASPTTVAS